MIGTKCGDIRQIRAAKKINRLWKKSCFEKTRQKNRAPLSEDAQQAVGDETGSPKMAGNSA
jgi:hypothetical protein